MAEVLNAAQEMKLGELPASWARQVADRIVPDDDEKENPALGVAAFNSSI